MVKTAPANIVLTRGKPRFPGRTELPIKGPPEFVADIKRLLDEARCNAPAYYQDALEYLPKAEHAPDHPAFADGTVGARSDGIFKASARERWDGFEGLRDTLWHEVGHNVDGDHETPGREDRANFYAREAVLAIEAGKRAAQAPHPTEPLPAPVPVDLFMVIEQTFPKRPSTLTDWYALGAGRF